MTQAATLIALKAEGRVVAIDAASIRRIVPAGGLLRVPLTLPRVAGVVARDGRAIPVYHLGAVTPPQEAAGPAVACEAGELKQIVIVEHEGALAGILVEGTDAVRGPAAPDLILDGRTLLAAAGAIERDSGGEGTW